MRFEDHEPKKNTALSFDVDSVANEVNNSIMVRRLLSMLLIVSTLVGPMICCCALQASSDSTHPSNQSERELVSLRRKSCCDSGAPEKQKPNSPKSNHGCPCKKQQSPQATAVQANSSAESFASTHRAAVGFLLFDFFRDSLNRSTGWMRSVDSERSPNVRSGRDILTAHHVLTC